MNLVQIIGKKIDKIPNYGNFAWILNVIFMLNFSWARQPFGL
jgi:hypothetical protein